MRRLVAVACATLFMFVAVARVDGQIWDRLTNPKVKINVQHPPLVALKGVTRVAVSEFQGECGAELTDRLTELVSSSGKFEVLDRFNLERMLAEQDFNFSGRVDSRSAVRLGKILGPSALIFGRVTRCRSETNNHLYRKDYRGRIIYQARTRANITASVQLVELATSRVLTAQTFDGAAERMNESTEGRPEAPDGHQLMTNAYSHLLAQLSRLILPWSETVEVLVFDDEKWNLKGGAKLMKAGDFAGAVVHFESILKEHTDTLEKDYGKLHHKALHNLGTALTYAGRPDDAIQQFQLSLKEKPQDVTSEALATARKIIGLQHAFRLQEMNAIAVNTGAPAPSREQPAAAASRTQRSETQSGPSAQAARTGAGVSPRSSVDPKPAAPLGIEQQLTRLKALFQKGLITQTDYDEQRKVLLKKLSDGQ